MENIPMPIRRTEQYLSFLTGNTDHYPEDPITREEKYLYYLCKNGAGGGGVTPEQIQAAVDIYLTRNPVQPGATAEQAQQIQTNKENIGQLSEDKVNKNGIKEIKAQNLEIMKKTASSNLLNTFDDNYMSGYRASNTTGNPSADTNWDLSGFISVYPGANLVCSRKLLSGTWRENISNLTRWYGYDSEKNYIETSYSYNQGITFYTVPEQVYYIRASFDNTKSIEVMIEKGENFSGNDFIPFEEYYIIDEIYLVEKPLSQLENDVGYIAKYVSDINLPNEIYAFAGKKMSLYFKNIMDYDVDDVYIQVASSNKGNIYSKKWEYTPESKESFTLRFNVFDKMFNHLIEDKIFTINVKDSSEKDALVVLVIGDSTVNAGVETQKILDLANEDEYNIRLLGTRGTSESPNQHEGRGGWTAEMYVNDAQNNSGSVKNAFYNPEKSKFDFNYYMNQNGYESVDCVFLQLGINDLFSSKTDEELDESLSVYFENMDYMVSSIHEFDEKIKIIINTVIPCSSDQDKFTGFYGMVQTVWRNHHNVYIANKKILQHYKGYANLYVSWYCASIDIDNNMEGNIHPNTAGYNELGEQMYSTMRAAN